MCSFMATSEGFRYLIYQILTKTHIIILILYILSPFDLIPEAIFGIFGLLDDLIIFCVLIMYLMNFYQQYLSTRDRQLYIN